MFNLYFKHIVIYKKIIGIIEYTKILDRNYANLHD